MMTSTMTAGASTSSDLSRYLDARYYRAERRAAKAWRQLTNDIADLDLAGDSLGFGLRVEEYVAATGLPERRVRRALAELARLGYMRDGGDRGWLRPEDE